MILLSLSGEFLTIGLFSVGGGMATVPFLMSLSERRGWFTLQSLSNIIAISEATPGPIGVNMSTYVGFQVAGVPGAILATLCLALPSFVIILLMSRLIGHLRGNRYFEAVFAALRPASVGLIAAVLLSLCIATFFTTGGGLVIHWKALALFLFLCLCFMIPKVKSLPIPVFLAIAAISGILFRMGA